jgi:hypothetical protein
MMKGAKMELKKIKLLVAELRVIASTLMSQYCQGILIQAAERLEETEKIAEFFREEAIKNLGGDRSGRRKRR